MSHLRRKGGGLVSPVYAVNCEQAGGRRAKVRALQRGIDGPRQSEAFENRQHSSPGSCGQRVTNTWLADVIQDVKQ